MSDYEIRFVYHVENEDHTVCVNVRDYGWCFLEDMRQEATNV